METERHTENLLIDHCMGERQREKSVKVLWRTCLDHLSHLIVMMAIQNCKKRLTFISQLCCTALTALVRSVIISKTTPDYIPLETVKTSSILCCISSANEYQLHKSGQTISLNPREWNSREIFPIKNLCNQQSKMAGSHLL